MKQMQKQRKSISILNKFQAVFILQNIDKPQIKSKSQLRKDVIKLEVKKPVGNRNHGSSFFRAITRDKWLTLINSGKISLPVGTHNPKYSALRAYFQ